MRKLLVLIGVLSFMILVSGCRAWRSEKPPFHPNPNLDWQAKYKAQTLPLMPVEDTVPYGRSSEPDKMEQLGLQEGSNSYLMTGKYRNGAYLNYIPLDVDYSLVKRGQERYNIYCSACHDKVGYGNGTVVQRGYLAPPSLHSKRVLEMKDGYIYWVITHGIRNMWGYAKQIELEDRWAIVAYVRALQKTQTARYYELDKETRNNLSKRK